MVSMRVLAGNPDLTLFEQGARAGETCTFATVARSHTLFRSAATSRRFESMEEMGPDPRMVGQTEEDEATPYHRDRRGL